MENNEHLREMAVFIGVDVGKGAHHAVALDRSGKRLFNEGLPNDKERLRAVLAGLKATADCCSVAISQP